MRHTMYQHLQERKVPMVIGSSERVMLVRAPANGL
jgi:hypothetical protein